MEYEDLISCKEGQNSTIQALLYFKKNQEAHSNDESGSSAVYVASSWSSLRVCGSMEGCKRNTKTLFRAKKVKIVRYKFYCIFKKIKKHIPTMNQEVLPFM